MAAAGRAWPGGDKVVHLVWDQLRRRIQAVVRECNCEAGESMWGVTEDDGSPGRLKVWDRTNRSSFLELSLDAAGARLYCRFGSSRNDRWTFHILPGGTLSRAAASYTLEEAVDQMLDGMVCA